MKVIIFLLIFVCLIVPVSALDGYRWYIPITIYSSQDLNDYQVRIPIVCGDAGISNATIAFTKGLKDEIPLDHFVISLCPVMNVFVRVNLTAGNNTIYLWISESGLNFGTNSTFIAFTDFIVLNATNKIIKDFDMLYSYSCGISQTNTTWAGKSYSGLTVSCSIGSIAYRYNKTTPSNNICVGGVIQITYDIQGVDYRISYESESNYFYGGFGGAGHSSLIGIGQRIAGTRTVLGTFGSRTIGTYVLEFCKYNNYLKTSLNWANEINATTSEQLSYPAVGFFVEEELNYAQNPTLYFMYVRRFVNPEPTVTIQYENKTELQLPNIRVSNLSVSAFSGNISVQNPTYINFTLSNPTNFNAGAFTVAIYDQTAKIGEYYISNLQAGASVNISHIWYPQYAGQRTVRVVADVNDEVEETSELDNIAEQTIQVLEPQFLVYNLNVYPKSGKEPLEITATAIVENIGGADGYYLATLYINNIAKQQYVLFVPASQTRQVNFTWTFNASGTYSVSISGLHPVYVYVLPQFTPPPIYNPWLNNTTDVLYNFTKGGWYMVAVYTFAQFQEIAFPLLYTFVFGISFIRTRNIATCVFMTLLFTALYVVFVPFWMMKIIYILSAVMIGGVLWMVFGRK